MGHVGPRQASGKFEMLLHFDQPLDAQLPTDRGMRLEFDQLASELSGGSDPKPFFC